MSTPDHEYADPWDAFRARVVAALADVVRQPSAFLVTEGPVVQVDPGPGIFGRRRRLRDVRAQVLALPLEGEDDVIFLQSVPADPGPKDFPVDAYARRAMQTAGWKAPGDPGYFSLAEDLFTARMSADDHRAIADLAARTYPILGVADPAQIDIAVVR